MKFVAHLGERDEALWELKTEISERLQRSRIQENGLTILFINADSNFTATNLRNFYLFDNIFAGWGLRVAFPWEHGNSIGLMMGCIYMPLGYSNLFYVGIVL